MTVIRVEHSKNYTCIINDTIRDKRLSFKARGIHHLLLSYPDGWRVNIEHLTSESDKDGKTAIASGLKELEELGYLTREKIHNELGHFCGWESVVREIPIDRKPDNRKTRKSGKPIIGKPDAGKTDNRKTCDIINTINSIQVTKEEILPPTPQGEKEREVQSLRSEDQEPSHAPTTIAQPQVQNSSFSQQVFSTGENIPPAAPEVVATTLKVVSAIEDLGGEGEDPFLVGRRQNLQKGTWQSCSRDPWMESQNNVNGEFAMWRFKNFYEPQGKGKSLADAKAEIKNNCIKARDLWEEYQAELQARAAKEARAVAMRGEVEENLQVEEPTYSGMPWRCRIEWIKHLKRMTPEDREAIQQHSIERQEAEARFYLENLERKAS